MSEHDEQVAVIQWASWIAAKRWPLAVIYGNANAAKMSIGAAMYMRAEGRTSGVPDITVATPRCGYGALYIEMKHGKGKLSQSQKEMIARLTAADNKCVVCYSAKEAIAEIEKYLSEA